MAPNARLTTALRYRVRFEEAEDPAESRFVFETPEGEIAASAHEALGPLSGGIRALNADSSVRAWATPAIHALRLMAAGALADPLAPDRQRLLDAGRSLDPDPARGQALVLAFVEALIRTAPAVATVPQSSTPSSSQSSAQSSTQSSRASSTGREPRLGPFSYRFDVEFLEAGPSEAGSSKAGPRDPRGVIARGSLVYVPEERGWPEAPTAELWAGDEHPWKDQARARVMRMLERLESSWPTARRLIASPGRRSIDVSAAELATLVDPAFTVSLLANRLTIGWPAGTRQSLAATAVLDDAPADPRSSRARPSRFTPDRGFRVSWKFTVDGHDLAPAELDELVASTSGLVRLRDQWVLVDRDRARHALSSPERDLSAFEALRAGLLGELELDGHRTSVDTRGWIDEVRRRLASRGEDRMPFTPPPSLLGTLRDYQVQGVDWMAGLRSLGLGGILADDMGLGKTFMLIALHAHLDLDAPTLVVCPASVMATWEREIAKFAPSQPVVRFHGPKRHLAGTELGFVVTTYATMRSSIEELSERSWGLVVADEAQHVKNPRSAAAQALRTLHGDMRMALTGTPVENNLGELWAILDWTTPGLLGTREQFRATWATPIERHRDDDVAKKLSTLIRPFVLRRRKIDPGIAPELPEKIDTDHLVSLTKEQIGLYESVSRAALTQIEQSQGIRRRGLVIRLITHLKQICNHPAQFLKEPLEDKLRLSARSGKLALLDDLLDEIIAEDGAALLFTQYTQMAALLTRHLSRRGIDHLYLHGGTSVRTRDRMVEQFQAGEAPVFVLSLKAAGTGLNLTRADHVIHFDRWWNPAVEDQATDRAHRIGQTRSVQVHRLIVEGSLEESIGELIDAKRALADAVVNSGEAAFTELTDAELSRLVALRH